MPAKYALVDAGLRFAMALLFLMSATTKVTETTAIQVCGIASTMAVSQTEEGNPCRGRQ